MIKSLPENNKISLNIKYSIKYAKKLYRKNKLYEAEEFLSKIKNHEYDNTAIKIMLARIYDKIAFFTDEAEYEDLAFDAYDDVINYSKSRRVRRKAKKLQERLLKRISQFNKNDYRAQSKADAMKYNEPRSPKSWFMIGANFSVRKDPFFVINAYENALKLNPNYISALFRIGYIYNHNLKNHQKALEYYHKIIKISPWADTVEPESVNIKIIIDTLCEMSQIYLKAGNFKKVISVFDYTMKFRNIYNEKVSMEYIKIIISNTNSASEKLDNNRALKKYVLKNYNYDFDNLLKELRLK